MPLYCAGLCDAVNIAPGASSDPAAKYNRSVDPRPRSTRSRPCARDPVGEGVDHADARRAHVTGDQDSGHGRICGDREPGEGDADRPGDALVELLGDHSPHVVGLEDGIQVRHGRQH